MVGTFDVPILEMYDGVFEVIIFFVLSYILFFYSIKKIVIRVFFHLPLHHGRNAYLHVLGL